MSRFGFETIPSGKIRIKLNLIHQTEILKADKVEKGDFESSSLERLDAFTLLGSVNAVLEAFRRARERMLKAKEGLDAEIHENGSRHFESQQEEKTERSD